MSAQTERVTLTLPHDVAQAARAEAEGNLSAYVTRAIRAMQVSAAARKLAQWQEATGDTFDDVREMAEDDMEARGC